VATSPLIKHFSALAKELEVVLPLSLFENTITRTTTRW
jgi:N-carbamoylputrescine amidase